MGAIFELRPSFGEYETGNGDDATQSPRRQYSMQKESERNDRQTDALLLYLLQRQVSPFLHAFALPRIEFKEIPTERAPSFPLLFTLGNLFLLFPIGSGESKK